MSAIRALKGAFTRRPSLWARPSSHIAFRSPISLHQPLSRSRTYSVDQSRESSFLQDYFQDQIEKPRSLEKRDRSKQTKEAHSTDGTDFDDREDEFSRILSPKQEKPKKPWLKKREESIARHGTAKADARRSRKTARNIALLEQEIRRRHAAGRPDVTSAIDPERSELTPRTAKEAIARWQELKEKDGHHQAKESRAVRALKRDIRREAKEARIFMASQGAEKSREQELEQEEKLEKLKASMAQRKNAEWEEEVVPVKTRREVSTQAQKNAVQTPEEPQENDSPEETAENPNEWEDELDDEAEWDGQEKLSGIERRRMKLLLRFKEGLQKKMGIPVGDTKPHPQIDAKCEVWLHNRIKAEKDREKRKKDRMAREHQKFLRKLAKKARKNAN
ncbi:hypothetical protein NEUTE1DRAFT_144127 [Neurospora tetrasperma FGSC 2508]|uniref:Uncharacterized protein n=1 Tax=Neurospora tetrasperma (strain FGSC 2508 / ATCC MYA-4615 / P0657) TaxID=510951 RepID=F8ME90_NEUT8|nr:uncharacterized protein NEUTE1DRAFT_144127 [Neurospora tetrasperma FGSC 2508]EGO60774.1 hypothetical protein NEUTE1DRAFT_144127 [Neurospora tetrasperma FGSC 2508]EGZ75238.1 hypothetical protein NEUTE2DRAFT_104777 [Neurospora tetrasperma FGSC 2509]